MQDPLMLPAKTYLANQISEGNSMEDMTMVRLINERDRLTAMIDDGSYREQHNKLFAARQAPFVGQ